MLLFLRGSGLVPRLTHFCDDQPFLITQWIPQTLDEMCLDLWGCDGLGYRLGDWCARYDEAAPSRPERGTRLDYAMAMTPTLPIEKVEGAAAGLASIPLCGSSLAHNDAALENNLYDAKLGILRCDFARSAFRPRGWDYIFTRHAVTERFPAHRKDILDAMSEGFEAAHRGSLRVDELDHLSDIFVALFAVMGDGHGN
ncbi:hypothetical protein [Nioella aestuarii]|uniref:hypothetical protein n=1 Tax=Nioella aestuarii TaxID=1662864 RepID=UPI003D7FB357